jgi:hypothetical protein
MSSQIAQEASVPAAHLIYFSALSNLLGSSCFILLGTNLLYANSGTPNLDGYYVVIGLSSLANEYTSNMPMRVIISGSHTLQTVLKLWDPTAGV